MIRHNFNDINIRMLLSIEAAAAAVAFGLCALMKETRRRQEARCTLELHEIHFDAHYSND